MKRIVRIIVTIVSILIVTACMDNNQGPYTVIFNSNGGTPIDSQIVEAGDKVIKPSINPTKDGYTFEYWYLDNELEAYNFELEVHSNLTLNALWKEIDMDLYLSKIEADYEALKNNFVVNKYQLNMSTKGSVNNSNISWSYDSKYISASGVVLPVLANDNADTVVLEAKFVNGPVEKIYYFEVDLFYFEGVEIETERTVPFKNLTTEYNIEDGELTLYFEENGSVPYVSILDFFDLLEGFIDPKYQFTETLNGKVLEIQYDYYDAEEDELYHLILQIDSENDTITTNDPAFYWAYIHSTATNYGRNIEYVDHPNQYYEYGHDLEYDLRAYNMDIVFHDEKVLLPYYIVNQLFAGSSYYNVYYNYDALYGIYSFPDSGTETYNLIRTSSQNQKDIPSDLLVHTFNYFAFALDYFYGLKDIMEVDTYYDLLFEHKSALLRPSANLVDQTIGDILVKKLDEPHTSYNFAGFYNRTSYTGPSYNSLNSYGPRFVEWYNEGLVATDNAIGAKWGASSSGWNASSANRPYYWFIDSAKTSVVLSLDSFSTEDIVEQFTYDKTVLDNILDLDTSFLPSINGYDKYFIYNLSSTSTKEALVLIKNTDSTFEEDYIEVLEALGFVYNTRQQSYILEDNDYTLVIQVKYDISYNAAFLYMRKYNAGEIIPVLRKTMRSVLESDSAVYMEFMLEKITKEAPDLKNIILDVTWNTGGNVGALYRVVGFVTKDPFKVSHIDRDTDSKTVSYVQITHEHDYSMYNWALLTTPTTFSAANSLAIVFRDNNLGPLIGRKTGGGASSITPILLPNGTAFTMSSNNIRAYIVSGDGTEENPYVLASSEFGIEPDYELTMGNLYNNQVLMDILNEYYPN